MRIDNADRIMSAAEVRPGLDYLTYIAPAWITEQIVGVTMGLAVPMVVYFLESTEQVLANLREIAVEMMVFAPLQWEGMASTIQAIGRGSCRGRGCQQMEFSRVGLSLKKK